MYSNKPRLEIDYIKKIDFTLRKEIINKIKNKENTQNVDLKIIRGVRDKETFFYFDKDNFITNYKPVYRCEYKNKNGENVVYYVKPVITNLNDYSSKCSNSNEETEFSLIEMGAMGYTIPEFIYSKDVVVNVKGFKTKEEYNTTGNTTKTKFNISINKDRRNDNTIIKFDILTTKNVEEFIDKKYLNSNKEIIEIPEIEAIDRLILQLYEINDNKTANVKIYKKINNKNKHIFFDPNIYYNINDLTMYYHFIQMAFFQNRIGKNFRNANFGALKNNNTFEYHTIKILVDFFKDQIKEKKQFKKYFEYKKMLEDFNSLTLNNLIAIGKYFKIIYNKNKIDYFSNYRFCTFLEQRKEKIIKKEEAVRQLLKKAYYYKKNKKIICEKFKKFNNKIDGYLQDVYTQDYQPVILSNLVGETYGNMSILNFKQPKGILDLKERENSDIKVKQLYKENKNRKLEDMLIMVDKNKIPSIKSKEDRRVIQNIILNELIYLANTNNISITELSCIILKSINNGGIELLNKNERDIYRKFKENMENKGLYSTKKIKNQYNNNIKFEKFGGLELKDLSKSFIELLVDNKKYFNVRFEKDQKLFIFDLFSIKNDI